MATIFSLKLKGSRNNKSAKHLAIQRHVLLPNLSLTLKKMERKSINVAAAVPSTHTGNSDVRCNIRLHVKGRFVELIADDGSVRDLEYIGGRIVKVNNVDPVSFSLDDIFISVHHLRPFTANNRPLLAWYLVTGGGMRESLVPICNYSDVDQMFDQMVKDGQGVADVFLIDSSAFDQISAEGVPYVLPVDVPFDSTQNDLYHINVRMEQNIRDGRKARSIVVHAPNAVMAIT